MCLAGDGGGNGLFTAGEATVEEEVEKNGEAVEARNGDRNGDVQVDGDDGMSALHGDLGGNDEPPPTPLEFEFEFEFADEDCVYSVTKFELDMELLYPPEGCSSLFCSS